MVLLEQLREELLTHIIPQLSHSWKTPMHQWCVLHGLPWETPLHHSMNIQLLLLQQAGNARPCDCQGVPLQPTLLTVFISLHCSSPPHRHCALPTGRNSPVQIIQLLMQNIGMLGRRALHPHSRAPQLSQAGWGLFQGIQQWQGTAHPEGSYRETAAPSLRETWIWIPGKVSLTTT